MEGATGTSTVEGYQRELRHFLDWISRRAGNSGPFNAQKQLTKTALHTYMAHLQSENHSISHCARVKSAVGAFARWLIEEKELLRLNRFWRRENYAPTSATCWAAWPSARRTLAGMRSLRWDTGPAAGPAMSLACG